jgi:hypothetical protein
MKKRPNTAWHFISKNSRCNCHGQEALESEGRGVGKKQQLRFAIPEEIARVSTAGASSTAVELVQMNTYR